jgi:hypothetical protein
VCARTLNYLEGRDEGAWVHAPQDEDRSHPVVAVPTTAIAALERCDFCSVDTTQFIVPARSFSLGTMFGGLDGNSVGAWGACSACAELIRTNRWTALARHVITTYRANGIMPTGLPDQELETRMKRLWRMLRANITGELIPR